MQTSSFGVPSEGAWYIHTWYGYMYHKYMDEVTVTY